MADEDQTKGRLEIGHVLFMDIVGYSRLLTDEQGETLLALNQIVLGTRAAQEAEAAGELLRLPTGDGMALVFASNVEAPVECALQVSQALKAQPGVRLRMGIHSGPVRHVVDVNGRDNIAGAGINIAQRVMDCGDTGHILVSRRVADDLATSRRWQPYLHDLGDCEVKHGVIVRLVNFYADATGNPAPPAKLGVPKGGSGTPAPNTARPAARGWFFVVSTVLAAAVLAFAARDWYAGHRQPGVPPSPASTPATPPPVAPVPEKSIAVLPFDNLSDDKTNVYFAEGIQDEILTDLAKVADLKVISRTSVMAFGPGHRQNVREIGVALGVAHVLEGSVQRAGNRVRVNMQLIDARTDAHVWAKRLDGDLTDVFAIQAEMAEQIVANLRVQLSPDEKNALAARPTLDLAAYHLYVEAKDIIDGYQDTPDWRETLLRAARLLEDATARDDHFTLAYCLLALAHDRLSFLGLDPDPARLEMERKAVETARRLQPGLGEVRLAYALYLYHGARDFAGARRELAAAAAALPNNAEVFTNLSYIDRREGRWNESRANLERSLALDPRNPSLLLNDQTVLYDMMRLYREEIRTSEAATLVLPASANYFRMIKAAALLSAGQPKEAGEEMDRLPVDYDPNGSMTFLRVCRALYGGHPDAAARRLAAYPGKDYPGYGGVVTPRDFLEGAIARAAGDAAGAARAFGRARGAAEAGVRDRPKDAAAWTLLGLIDAGLGRKEDALREGREAVRLRPVSADAMEGPGVEGTLAMICAWTGEEDEAMRHLLALAKLPGGPDYGQLRYDPAWAGLRKRADFQAMLAGLEPKL